MAREIEMTYSRMIPLYLKQPADGTPYRPSNGTEGDGFQEGFCHHCKADRAFIESGGDEEGCHILARTMTYEVGELGYPTEWVWKDGEPICTAFDDVALPITNAERAAQMPLIP